MPRSAALDDEQTSDLQGSGHSTPTLSSSAPIDIPSPGGTSQERRRRKTRRRAPSEASSLSSQSGDSPTTPPSSRPHSEDGASPDVATSPILSYFLAQASPTRTNPALVFPNRRKTVSGTTAVFQEDDDPSSELPHVLHHARRLSSSWATTGTIGVQQKGPITDSQQERNVSLMRRLSLTNGTNPSRPSFESFAAAQSIPEGRTTSPHAPHGPRRSATLALAQEAKHRPPSPMGERMLKGHFDGF